MRDSKGREVTPETRVLIEWMREWSCTETEKGVPFPDVAAQLNRAMSLLVGLTNAMMAARQAEAALERAQ